MKPANLARQLGLSKAQIGRLIAAGMPTDSVESAKHWRLLREKSRKRGAKAKISPEDLAAPLPEPAKAAPIPAKTVVKPDTESDSALLDTMDQLKKRIEAQSTMAAEAQNRFMEALKGNDVLEAKQAGEMNNATQKTLIMLEAEYQRRLLENGTLLTLGAATERFQALLGDLRQYIDQGEQEFSTLTNPENPARGLLGYREFRQRLYTKLQKMIHA